jgi:hypothetical protein
MLRLCGPGVADGNGVETGVAEGVLDEPPQDDRRAARSRARLGRLREAVPNA